MAWLGHKEISDYRDKPVLVEVLDQLVPEVTSETLDLQDQLANQVNLDSLGLVDS